MIPTFSRPRARTVRISASAAVLLLLIAAGASTPATGAPDIGTAPPTTTPLPPADTSVNLAPYAVPTVSDSARGTSAAGLNDTVPTAAATTVGAPWVAPGAGGTWAKLTWEHVQPVASIQLVGTTGLDSRILAGRLSFSDGSRLDVGQVISNPAFPTMISFEPRSIWWVKFEPVTVAGSGTMGLAEFRVYPTGVTPKRVTNPDPKTLANDPVNPKCSTAAPSQPVAGRIYVRCPVTNSTVSGTRSVTFTAPGLTRVLAKLWNPEGGATVASIWTTVNANGVGVAKVPFGKAPSGPVTVELTGRAGASLADAKPTYLQLYNASNGRPKSTSPVPAAPGYQRTLVFREEFSAPISYSLDGRIPLSDYPAAKPEYWGTGQFSSAIFPDPTKGFDTMQVVDKRYLRIESRPNPAGYADPSGWGRTSIGGLLASARAGGSGFSAQYGYFETRMLVPGNPGTWPAFWVLPSTNLIARQKDVAEIDGVELYGHDPQLACHSTHYYHDNKDDANTQCLRPFSSVKAAATWHTYGVDVKRNSITYYIDGKATLTQPQVGGGGDPMFFLVNLGLGGGWPVDLDRVHNRSAVYVDYVRVYV